MDVFQAMRVFRRVVELESFSATARDQRLSNAAVSKIVRSLEERLKTTLIHRTTRRLSLTADGIAYYDRCVRILDDVDETERSLCDASAAPRGILRVNAPMSFGLLHLSPLVPEILAAYPALEIDVRFDDRFVDLVEEGVDVVIRIAQALPDSASLTAHRLASARRVICASPSYLKARGVPKKPADLASHDCIVYRDAREWELASARGSTKIAVRGRLSMNNSIAIRDSLLAGIGLALIPSFYVSEHLARGELREVLSDHSAKPLSIHAVYPRSKRLSPKVRVFIDHVRDRFAAAPWAIVSSERKVNPRRR
jgi:DNA-binding transcriptional LysR family regulator